MSTITFRRPAMAAVVLTLLALTLALAHHRAGWAATSGVEVGDNFFRPQEITIAAGDTVRWTYNGFSTHNVQAADGSWDSGDLTAGIPYSRTFDQPGEYAYFCKYHGGCSADGANCGGQFGRITVVGDEPDPEPEPSPSETQPPSPSPEPEPSPEPSQAPSPTATSAPSEEPSGEPTEEPAPEPSPDETATDDEPETEDPAPSGEVDGDTEGDATAEDTTDDASTTGSDDAAASDDDPEDGDGSEVSASAGGPEGGGGLKVLATLLLAATVIGLVRTTRATA